MIQIRTINKLLPDGYELLKSEGCFYFVGDGEYGDTYGWFTSTVYVNAINHLSKEQWIESFFSLVEQYGN